MKLLLMTTPHFFVEEHQILTALFDEGLELLHLRKPDSEPIYCERLLSLLPETYRKRIVTHDHYYLKGEFGLRGIHLNHRHSPPENYKGRVTCSCQNLGDLPQLKRACDYVIFAPSSESSDGGTFGSTALTDYALDKRIDKRVMAMGDVSLDNVHALRDAGFGGAVLYGCIWNRFNLHTTQDFKDLIMQFHKLQRAAE